MIHHCHAALVVFLLLSGVSLYVPAFRTFFNEVRVPLVQLHVAIGIVYIGFVICAAAFALRYAKRKPALHRFNVWFHVVLFAAWTVSGLLMRYYSLLSIPESLRNYSVAVHDYTTFIAIPWIAAHSIGHATKRRIPWPAWWRGRAPEPAWVTENRPDRRDFLKACVILAASASAGALLKWVSPVLTAAEQLSKSRGYFRIYNVTNDYPRWQGEYEWQLVIDGLVNEPKQLSWQNVRELPWQTIVDDFHCVTGWSVRGVELRGVRVRDLFRHFDIRPEGQFITAYSGDKVYFDSFTADQLIQEEAMLVFEMDGAPLKQIQGYPCRLYHPDMYGYKSVKWLTRLTVTKDREIGYWQQSGDYDLNGYL